MHTVQIKIVLLLLVSALLPLRSVYPQNADSLLFQVSEMYKDLKNFHLEGETIVRVRKGWQTQTTEYSVRLAQEFPLRYRVELGGDRGRLLVSNDSMTIVYHPESLQYIERPEPLETANQRRDFPDVIKMYARLDDLTETVHMIEVDTVYTVNGVSRKAYHIEIVPKVTPQTRGHSINYQFLIDQKTLAILKERKSTYIPDTYQGAVSMTQITSYDIVNVSGDIPDSLFTYKPPEEAERVRKIDAFPNIPVSLYGQQAPLFSLQLVDSPNELSLEDLKGKVVVLNFWATWCAPCRAEMSALNTLYDRWKEDGLEVIAINEEELPETVTSYLEEEALDIVVVLDKFGVVSRQMEVFQLPTTFILDREGVIVHHLIGARTEEDFNRFLSPYFPDDLAGD